jgi:hypothetical protein
MSSNSVDSIVNIEEYNNRNISTLLEQLNTVNEIFHRMKVESIEFENCVGQVIEMIELGGDDAIESALAMYNTFLSNFYNQLCLLVNIKVKNQNGLARVLLGGWTETTKTTSFDLSYRESQYRWIKNKSVCNVDRIKITKNFDHCTAASYPIYIGCSTITFDTLTFGEQLIQNLILVSADETASYPLHLVLTFPSTKDRSDPFTISDFGFTVTDLTGTVLSI